MEWHNKVYRSIFLASAATSLLEQGIRSLVDPENQADPQLRITFAYEGQELLKKQPHLTNERAEPEAFLSSLQYQNPACLLSAQCDPSSDPVDQSIPELHA